jgi:hypothetical protein
MFAPDATQGSARSYKRGEVYTRLRRRSAGRGTTVRQSGYQRIITLPHIAGEKQRIQRARFTNMAQWPNAFHRFRLHQTKNRPFQPLP